MAHQIRNDSARHAYVLTVDGREVGHLSYLLFAGAVDLEHTEIDEEFSGQGLSGELARHALEDIRTRELKAMITCPAVRSFINKNPQYADLVTEP